MHWWDPPPHSPTEETLNIRLHSRDKISKVESPLFENTYIVIVASFAINTVLHLALLALSKFSTQVYYSLRYINILCETLRNTLSFHTLWATLTSPQRASVTLCHSLSLQKHSCLSITLYLKNANNHCLGWLLISYCALHFSMELKHPVIKDQLSRERNLITLWACKHISNLKTLLSPIYTA